MRIQNLQQTQNKSNTNQSFGVRPQAGLLKYIRENEKSIDLSVLKKLKKIFDEPKTKTVGIDYYHYSCDDREGLILLSDSRYPKAKQSSNGEGVIIDKNSLRYNPNDLINRILDLIKNPKTVLEQVDNKIRPNHESRISVAEEIDRLDAFMTDENYKDKINAISIYSPRIFHEKGDYIPFSMVVKDNKEIFNNGDYLIPANFTENLKYLLDSQVNIHGQHRPELYGPLRRLNINVGDKSREETIFLEVPDNKLLNFSMKPEEFKEKLNIAIEKLKKPKQVIEQTVQQVVKKEPSRISIAASCFKNSVSDKYKIFKVKFKHFVIVDLERLSPAFKKQMQEQEKFDALIKDGVYGEKIRNLPFYKGYQKTTLDELIKESERTNLQRHRVCPNISDNLRILVDSSFYKDNVIEQLNFNLSTGYSHLKLKRGNTEIKAFRNKKDGLNFTDSPKSFKKQLEQLKIRFNEQINEDELKSSLIDRLGS